MYLRARRVARVHAADAALALLAHAVGAPVDPRDRVHAPGAAPGRGARVDPSAWDRQTAAVVPPKLLLVFVELERRLLKALLRELLVGRAQAVLKAAAVVVADTWESRYSALAQAYRGHANY